MNAAIRLDNDVKGVDNVPKTSLKSASFLDIALRYDVHTDLGRIFCDCRKFASRV